MTGPSLDGVKATKGYQQYPYYNYGNYATSALYNPAYTDMETMMASGYDPSGALNGGLDYGIFNSLGYSNPYGYGGYDSFNYANPAMNMGMGMGMYGYDPMMTQAMVQSQTAMIDGIHEINKRQRQHTHQDRIAELQYNTDYNDAKDTNHEDTVRRDTNFKHACEILNERLEAKDTDAALEAYNYAVRLMATVYDDVDDKRLDETPSRRAAIKGAFERKYQEVFGVSFKDKIDDCLPGAFGSGFKSVFKGENIMSKEEFKAVVDDRNVDARGSHDAAKGFGKITPVLGGILGTGLAIATVGFWPVAGVLALGAGIGLLAKKLGE